MFFEFALYNSGHVVLNLCMTYSEPLIYSFFSVLQNLLFPFTLRDGSCYLILMFSAHFRLEDDAEHQVRKQRAGVDHISPPCSF